jgi:Ca-activated chloride channel homolog
MQREDAEKLLGALIFDDLDEVSKAELLAYLQTDDDLRERLVDMRMTVKVASDAVQQGPDPVLDQRHLKSLKRLARQGQSRRRQRIVVIRRFAVAAVIFIVIALIPVMTLPTLNRTRVYTEFTPQVSAPRIHTLDHSAEIAGGAAITRETDTSDEKYNALEYSGSGRRASGNRMTVLRRRVDPAELSPPASTPITDEARESTQSGLRKLQSKERGKGQTTSRARGTLGFQSDGQSATEFNLSGIAEEPVSAGITSEPADSFGSHAIPSNEPASPKAVALQPSIDRFYAMGEEVQTPQPMAGGGMMGGGMMGGMGGGAQDAQPMAGQAVVSGMGGGTVDSLDSTGDMGTVQLYDTDASNGVANGRWDINGDGLLKGLKTRDSAASQWSFDAGDFQNQAVTGPVPVPLPELSSQIEAEARTRSERFGSGEAPVATNRPGIATYDKEIGFQKGVTKEQRGGVAHELEEAVEFNRPQLRTTEPTVPGNRTVYWSAMKAEGDASINAPVTPAPQSAAEEPLGEVARNSNLDAYGLGYDAYLGGAASDQTTDVLNSAASAHGAQVPEQSGSTFAYHEPVLGQGLAGAEVAGKDLYGRGLGRQKQRQDLSELESLSAYGDAAPTDDLARKNELSRDRARTDRNLGQSDYAATAMDSMSILPAKPEPARRPTSGLAKAKTSVPAEQDGRKMFLGMAPAPAPATAPVDAWVDSGSETVPAAQEESDGLASYGYDDQDGEKSQPRTPGLSKLPLIGNLFSQESIRDTKAGIASQPIATLGDLPLTGGLFRAGRVENSESRVLGKELTTLDLNPFGADVDFGLNGDVVSAPVNESLSRGESLSEGVVVKKTGEFSKLVTSLDLVESEPASTSDWRRKAQVESQLAESNKEIHENSHMVEGKDSRLQLLQQKLNMPLAKNDTSDSKAKRASSELSLQQALEKKAEEDGRTLTIQAPPAVSEPVVRALRKLDTPRKQVLIEAAIIDLDTPVNLTPPTEPDSTDLPPSSRFKSVPVNPWVLSARDHLSTFALDVDTASYSLCRRYIRSGYRPPAGAVRMEEFVNSFDYNYPQRDKPTFSVYAQGAKSPFAPAGRDLTLLKIGVKARTVGRDQQKPAHLVVVVDASASMGQPDRLPLVQYGLNLMLDKLSPQDRVTLITCAEKARLHAEGVSVQQKETLRQAIGTIQPAGSTNLLAGLQLGYSLARRQFVPGQVNHVVLCSDGVANVGQTEADAVLAAVAADRQQGITLTSVGVGFGTYNDTLLEALANKGDGSYVFLDSAQQARVVFVDQLTATLQGVAKDARIQVDFDPRRVRRYRLIGYENRDIEDKEFRNDSIDAGEVGSGQCSTALYEVELTGSAQQVLGMVYVRYRDVATNQMQEIAQPIRSPVIQKRKIDESPRFYLAAGAATFAEWLRQSEHARQLNPGELLAVMEKVTQALPLDRHARELTELIRQAEHLPVAP